MRKTKLQIDLVSDVVCPWCIIGYEQLVRALEQFSESLQFEIRWHPFELNPDMPPGGQNLREHLSQKYGTTLEDSIASRKRLREIGESLGFTFNYFDDMRIYNTSKAHQLLNWAADFDKQTELKLQLFSAYFSEGKVIDDSEVLVEIAGQVGLDVNQAQEVLQRGLYIQEVRNEEMKWLNRGVRAVPTFVINEAGMISGAQGVETLRSHIAKIV